MPLVTIASNLDTAIRMQSVPAPGMDPEFVYTIVGARDPGAVAGFGLTYDVDAAVFAKWQVDHPGMEEFVKAVTDGDIEHMSDPANTQGYEIGLEAAEDAAPPAGPPVLIDLPNVAQFGAVLRCTEGNWENAPDSKTFAWQMDGVANGVTTPAYAVQPSDVGHSFACVVTATNALGSATAPVSNSVIAA